jgi:hypothetical protein
LKDASIGLLFYKLYNCSVEKDKRSIDDERTQMFPMLKKWEAGEKIEREKKITVSFLSSLFFLLCSE